MTSELFKKHMNQKVSIMIGEDEFNFVPLNVNQFAIFMYIGDQFEKMEKKGIPMSKEFSKDMLDLYANIVKTSYPDQSDEDIENFVVTNLSIFQDIVIKLAPTNMDERKINQLKKIKEMQAAAVVPQPSNPIQVATPEQNQG